MARESSSPCILCDAVTTYVDLAGEFTSDLSEVLISPMWLLFLSLAGLWIMWHGFKMMIGQADLAGLGKESVYVFIAAVLLGGQGPGLVMQTYDAALSVIGSGASVALSVGSISDSSATPNGLNGMTELVRTAEGGVLKVFGMAAVIASQTGLSDPLAPLIYALLLVLPYLVLLIVYFAQVVVAIFRVMMLAALSPILMMCFGFGWGRGMAYTGLRTLFASFMVLFGSTVALAVCLYGVKALDIANPELGAKISDTLTFTNPALIVAIILGWLGTAFMAEATSIANSVTHSQLSNQAATIISAGMTATGLGMLKSGPLANLRKNAGDLLGKGGGALTDALRGKDGGTGIGGALGSGAQQILDRIKKPTIDKGN